MASIQCACGVKHSATRYCLFLEGSNGSYVILDRAECNLYGELMQKHYSNSLTNETSGLERVKSKDLEFWHNKIKTSKLTEEQPKAKGQTAHVVVKGWNHEFGFQQLQTVK